MMKFSGVYKLIASFILLAGTAAISCSVLAKEITMYDQPKNDGKAVGTVDLATGIIPIFTPKDNTAWMKVADPRNGNVGWVKASDIKDATGGSMSFTYSQKPLNDGKGPGTYQVFQFGNAAKPDAASQANMEKLQAQQKAIQENMQNNLKQMINDLNNLYHNQMQMLEGNDAGNAMNPVVAVPATGNTTKK